MNTKFEVAPIVQRLLNTISFVVQAPAQVTFGPVLQVGSRVKFDVCVVAQNVYQETLDFDAWIFITDRDVAGVFLHCVINSIERILCEALRRSLRINGKEVAA